MANPLTRARASKTESFIVLETRLSRCQHPKKELSDREGRVVENTYPNERHSGLCTREATENARKSSLPHSQGARDQAERIVGIFYEARRDYHDALQTDGFTSTATIRFLRDTAENALLYLRQNAMMDHAAVPDLQESFALARDKAAELCGGRKRHFDDEGRRSHKRSRRAVDSYRPSSISHRS